MSKSMSAKFHVSFKLCHQRLEGSNVNPQEVAHFERPHLDLLCLQIQLQRTLIIMSVCYQRFCCQIKFAVIKKLDMGPSKA